MKNLFNLTTTKMNTMMSLINYSFHAVVNTLHGIDNKIDVTDIKDPYIVIENPLHSSDSSMTSSMKFKVVSTDESIIYHVTFDVFKESVGLVFDKLPVEIPDEKEYKHFKTILKMNLTALFLTMNSHERDLKFTKLNAQITTIEFLNSLVSSEITIDQFINEIKDIDDINYSKVLYLIDRPNQFTHMNGGLRHKEIKQHLEKLLISHMYNWESEIISHIPAFYIENGDLQYLEWWDPYVIHDYFNSDEIDKVVKII